MVGGYRRWLQKVVTEGGYRRWLQKVVTEGGYRRWLQKVVTEGGEDLGGHQVETHVLQRALAVVERDVVRAECDGDVVAVEGVPEERRAERRGGVPEERRDEREEGYLRRGGMRERRGAWYHVKLGRRRMQ